MADDTALGRPLRHERAAVRKRDPSKTRTVHVAGESSRPCAGCGVVVELKIDAELPEFLRDLARARIESDAPVLCVECEQKEDEREAAVAEQGRRVLLLEERLRRSGVPPKWRTQAFESLEADTPRLRALQRAREWSAGEVRGLVLWGPVGRGKTAIAAAAANERMAIGDVRWLPVAELLMALSSPFGSKAREDAAAALSAAKGRAALVLDDLDKLKPTEHAVTPLYVAINAWIEADLPLLVTLNRDLDALASWLPETFGAAISSRLAGYCKVQQVGGDDRRLS